MYQLKINGKDITIENDKKLLDFLRDDMRLVSVKDGCSSGACGTCTVIIDGKAVKACVGSISKLQGKSIITVEGLSQREKDVYAYSFAEEGAVQCGFCIPGMVISTKALLDVNNNPSDEEIKKAIRGNICRCTGYVKIEKAIKLAAEFFRENREIPKHEFKAIMGEDFHRVDAYEKILGTGKYVDDIVLDGMIYGKALRSKYPRAKIVKIDISKAKAHPDAVAVLTAKDVPGKNKLGHLVQDWDVMIHEGDITRYIGDALALVATKHKETLNEILNLIEVEYEELLPLTCPEDALKEDAPKIHETGNILSKQILKRGNVEEAIKNSKYVVTKKYSTPFTDHAFMEPECAIAIPQGEDGIMMYTGGQSVYDEQREISHMLNISEEKVRVVSKLVGGGFGGKEDMSVQHHAALLAWHTKFPVKVKFSRQESLNIHPKRHAMEMEFTTACDENGKLTALRARVVSDTGAYASLGGPVLQRACTHAAGPYNYQNVDIEGIAVYTNNPPGGAFRGFGVTQTTFANECNLNMLAEMIGISPWEIRYRNAIKPGDVLPNGQIADDTTALVECLEAVKEDYEENKYAGIACALKNAGLGVGVPDYGRCIISVEEGKIHIRTSAACIGQGIATVMMQMACEVLKVSPNLIIVEPPDTSRTPNTGTTTASRQTLFTGEAVVRASKALKKDLDKTSDLSELNGKEYYGEYFGKTDPMGSEKENPVSHIAYGYAAQVVVLDDDGKAKKVVAAYDVGKIVNPKSCTSQIEGGVVMGLGFAFTEDFVLNNSIPKSKYGTLGLLRSTDVPEIEVKIVDKEFTPILAHGAKGVGELATIPTAPAAQGAYYKFDGVFRTKLPLEKTSYKK